MQYRIEMYPAKVADALPEFAAKLPAGEATFDTKDLIIGTDPAGKYRFGVAERRPEPTAPLERVYLFSVDNEGRLEPLGADRSPAANEHVIDGGIARAVVVALTTHRRSGSTVPLATIGWRSTDEIVTVMFVPARADNERPIVGAATTLGGELHYHVSRSELTVVKATLAR